MCNCACQHVTLTMLSGAGMSCRCSVVWCSNLGYRCSLLYDDWMQRGSHMVPKLTRALQGSGQPPKKKKKKKDPDNHKREHA